MQRRTLILSFLAIAVVFTILYVRADRTVDIAQQSAIQQTFQRSVNQNQNQNQNLPGRVDSESGRTGTTSALPPVQNQPTNAQALQRDLAREIQQLQANLDTQRQVLQQRETALDQLQTETEAFLTEQVQNTNPLSPASSVDVQAQTQELHELSATLEEMRAAREEIRREEEEAIVIRENANQLQIARIDAELQQVEEAQATTRSRLEQWAQDKAPVNGLAPPNQELETLFAQQQQQIDALRAQRLALTTDLHVQADSIYNLSQQARSQLRAEEQNIRSQIFSLQNEIRRTQRQQVQSRQSEQSRVARLKEAERLVQAEQGRVRAIETSLQNKRNELRQLK